MYLHNVYHVCNLKQIRSFCQIILWTWICSFWRLGESGCRHIHCDCADRNRHRLFDLYWNLNWTMGEVCKLKTYYIIFAMTFLIPVLWIKTIKKLTIINFFALAVIISALSIIIFYDITYIVHNEYEDWVVKFFNFWEYPLFFGIAVLNFEGNPASLNVQASLMYPRKYTKVLVISAILTTLIVLT